MCNNRVDFYWHRVFLVDLNQSINVYTQSHNATRQPVQSKTSLNHFHQSNGFIPLTSSGEAVSRPSAISYLPGLDNHRDGTGPRIWHVSTDSMPSHSALDPNSHSQLQSSFLNLLQQGHSSAAQAFVSNPSHSYNVL